LNWFVLYTKPKNEKKVASALSLLGMQVYCPLITVVKQWSDRKKTIQQPLLSSYIFVKLEEKDRSKVFDIPGVVRYLFWLGKPAIVRDFEINHIKELLQEKYK
jgi:transcriptional antiterminator RfaH